MGKTYTNHLHFLSYFSKCAVDNAENSISEPLNLKIFWRSMPPDPLLCSAFGLLTFFPLRTPSKSHSTSLKSINTNLENLLVKAVSGGHFSSSHYQPETFMVQIWTGNVLKRSLLFWKCMLEKGPKPLSSIIESLNAGASFNETATVLVKLILVMSASSALSERSFSA